MQQLFGVLCSVCAFGGIPKREEKWAFSLRYKYKYANTQIKMIICMRICILGQKITFFAKTNMQMRQLR
jgi:hypothetical protein